MFAVGVGAEPPAQFIVCAAPSICTAFGIYPVPPCTITIVTVIDRLVVVGTFVKFAVKFAAALVW